MFNNVICKMLICVVLILVFSVNVMVVIEIFFWYLMEGELGVEVNLLVDCFN